jgi:hypothetical protein
MMGVVGVIAFLLISALLIWAAFNYLKWRRESSVVTTNKPSPFSPQDLIGWMSSWGLPFNKHQNHPQNGYDPLSNQQFFFDEELDMELRDYDFSSNDHVPESLGSAKLRSHPGSLNSLPILTTQQPHSTSHAVPDSVLPQRQPSSNALDDDDELLKW